MAYICGRTALQPHGNDGLPADSGCRTRFNGSRGLGACHHNWNAITAAVYALVWLSWRRMWVRKLSEGLAAQAEEFLKLHITSRSRRQCPRGGAGGAAISGRTWMPSESAPLPLAGRSAGWRLASLPLRSFGSAPSIAGQSAPFPLPQFSSAPAVWLRFQWRIGIRQGWSGFHVLTSAAAVTAWLMCLLRSLPLLVERRVGSVSDLFERPGRPQLKELAASRRSWPVRWGHWPYSYLCAV